jgi:hypothetical protein
MLLPLHIHEHFILMVFRMNDDHQPELSVVDSKGHYLKAKYRRRVYDFMSKIARMVQWYNHVCEPEEFKARKPAYTT